MRISDEPAAFQQERNWVLEQSVNPPLSGVLKLPARLPGGEKWHELKVRTEVSYLRSRIYLIARVFRTPGSVPIDNRFRQQLRHDSSRAWPGQGRSYSWESSAPLAAARLALTVPALVPYLDDYAVKNGRVV